MAFVKLVEQEIFRPLGITSAAFSLSEAERNRLVSGYDSDGRTPIPYWHTLYRAFGGINVSPRDMVPLVQLFLKRRRHGPAQRVSEHGIIRIETPETSLAARAARLRIRPRRVRLRTPRRSVSRTWRRRGRLPCALRLLDGTRPLLFHRDQRVEARRTAPHAAVDRGCAHR
ncbi:MAG: serine hydrolase [Gammaproteobacteria bacterium]